MSRQIKKRAMSKAVQLVLVTLITFMITLPAFAIKGQIFKWKEENGTVRYSDTPPSGNVPYETLMGEKGVLLTPATDGVQAESRTVPVVTPQNAMPEKAEDASDPKAAQEKERQLTEAANLKIKQQNCAGAKARLHTFEQGGRISRMTEQGERVYYDDAAIAAGLTQAKKDIEEFCE
jgi:hypothetical protein